MELARCHNTNKIPSRREGCLPASQHPAPLLPWVPTVLSPLPTPLLCRFLHRILVGPGWPPNTWLNNKHEWLWWSCQPLLFVKLPLTPSPGSDGFPRRPASLRWQALSSALHCLRPIIGRSSGAGSWEERISALESVTNQTLCLQTLTFWKEHFAVIKYLCTARTWNFDDLFRFYNLE